MSPTTVNDEREGLFQNNLQTKAKGCQHLGAERGGASTGERGGASTGGRQGGEVLAGNQQQLELQGGALSATDSQLG